MHQGPPSATGGFVSSVSLPIIRRSINTRTDTGNRLTLLFCAYEMMSKTDGSLWKHWFSLPKIHQNFSWSLRRLDKPRQKNRLKKRQEEPEETLITINYAVEGLSVRASEHYDVSFVFSLFPLDSSLTYEDSIRKHQYLSGIPFSSKLVTCRKKNTKRNILYTCVSWFTRNSKEPIQLAVFLVFGIRFLLEDSERRFPSERLEKIP